MLLLVAILTLLSCPTTAHAAGDDEEFAQIGAGENHSLAIKADGTVWAWGKDGDGQLGNDATLADQNLPVAVAGLTNVRQVAAGYHHSVALKSDGTVWTWGDDTAGQLGDNTTIADKSTPVQVAGLTGVRHISAGGFFTLAVKADGTAWSWGNDDYGQLGNDATLASKPLPVQISGLVDIRQMAAGADHAYAVRADGTVWSWGQDSYGQLGDDATIANKALPVQIVGLAGIRQVEAGYYHGAAVAADGTVWTWGRDSSGQLGDGTSLTNRPTPVQVTTLVDVRQVDLGQAHSIALKTDGTVWTWGADAQGQLGDGATLTTQPVPVQVTALTGVRQVAADYQHSLAILADGGFRSWGWDGWGQLGDDSVRANKAVPVQIAISETCRFLQVAAGASHTIALKADGTVWTWGSDSSGQLGDDAALTNWHTPVQVTGLAGVRQVAAGGSHSVAVKADGTVWTWGLDTQGQLGNDAALADQPTPVQVTGLTGIRQVTAGASHSVAMKADGTVMTWGLDAQGQLGDNASLANQPTPVLVAGLSGVRQVAAGSSHTVVSKADGTVWSWGSDSAGQLGDGAALANQPTPVQTATVTRVRQVAGGGSHSVAAKADGTAWTWGSDSSGQLGDDAALANKPSPVQVAGLGDTFQVAAGQAHSLALTSLGESWSWGQDTFGQLGDGATLADASTPVQVATLAGPRQLAAGDFHGAAVKGDGTISSWGRDDASQLGDNTALTNMAVPATVKTPCAVTAPATPSNVAPAGGTANATPTLTATSFSDADADEHQASQWQVRTDSGTYATPLADSGVSGSALTSWVEPVALTAGSTYWFHVRYRDASGLWSAYSTETAFVYDPNPPLVPTLISPADGAVVQSPVLTATYLDSAPPSNGRVEYQVCTTAACSTVLESGYSTAVASGTNAPWSHTRPSGVYFWQARSVDIAGSVSAWSVARSFDFRQPPVTPSLVSPAAAAWVTTTTPNLTATYSDPDGDVGRDTFQLCRSDAGATDWGASCAAGFASVTTASGSSGIDKSAATSSELGQGDWYWRASSTDAGGGSSAFTTARLLRVDSLPPTALTGVDIRRSGLGKITISWNASTDAGIGGVNYDVDWSTDGSTWASVCADVTVLTCEKSGLAGGSLPFIRVRACDALGNCTTWQGKVGGSATGYYLRTSVESAPLTGTTDKRATVASGTANSNTAQRVDSGEVGWMQLQPGVVSTLNPTASEPAGSPAGNYGWLIEETAGATLASGGWAVTVTTDSDNTGVARIQCRAWIVTVTSGAISASSNYQSAYTDSVDVYEPGQQTHSCQLPGLATQTTLTANQYVYTELYLHATTGGSAMNNRLYLIAEGTGSAISIPPPGTAPNTPTVTSPALSDSTVDLAGTYTHPLATQGAIEYEYASDAGFTSITQTGSSALLTSGAMTTMTSEPLPSGSYWWRARARDTATLTSTWVTGTVVVSTAPTTPVNTDPADAGSTTDSTPALSATAFSDPDTGLGDTHTSSQFQISLNGYDWNTGQDSGTIAATTNWTVPVALSVGATYQWHVRYLDAYGGWSSWSPATTFAVVAGGAITLSLDTASLNLGLQAVGVDDFATVTATVSTGNTTGYNLTATGTATGSDASSCTCATPFADWTGTGATPTTWTSGTSGYAAVTVRDAQGGRLAKWGTGTATAESDTTTNKYAALTPTTITLHDRATAPTGNDLIPITIRANPSAATSAATHTETITITALTNP